MNKTLSIGLAGFSFVIEEHAYIKLSDYLAALRNSLDASEADEVMHDIEIRMVELFKDVLGKREVINADDVDRVINQIGKPEQIEEQEEAYFSEKTSKKENKNSGNASRQKQLFRDTSIQKIAGVCAGLAHYTGMDVTLMRAIWLIVFLVMIPAAGSAMLIALLYIILWAVLPKAQTASDFLKMKGQPVNFDTLKAESNKIVQFANESTQRVGEIYNENRPYINKAGNGLWNIIRYFFGVIFALMGLSLLIGSFAMFGAFDGSNVSFFENVGFYLQENNLGFFLVALAFLTIFIPALIFLFLAIKLISPKTTFNNAGYVFGALVLLWIGLAAFSGFSALKYKTQYSGHNEETENVSINTESDSIVLDVKKVAIPQNFKSYWDDVYSDGKTIYKEDWINVDVKRQDIKTPYIILKKEADGYNQPLSMKVPLEINGNNILLPNYIMYDYRDRFRDYRLNYELVVPKSTKVIKQKEWGINLNDNENDSENSSNREEKSQITINGKTWDIVKTGNQDSVIINNKKYSSEQAERMMDSVDVDLNDLNNVDINIKNGKKEISIKTNK